MRLMGALGVFFAEGYHLIVEVCILWGSLDDHDIVHLSCICFSQGSGNPSRCWSSGDGTDFSNEPRPVVFNLFLLHRRFHWTTVRGMTDVFLQLTLSDECLHLLL